MEQALKQSSQPLFTLTGNPFVDAGLAVICAITEKSEVEQITTEDLKKAIKEAYKFYSIKEWRGALHGLIFPNAEIGNPSVYKKRPNAYYDDVLQTLVNNLPPLNNQGNCVICGKRNGTPNIRTRVPMLGSKKLANFFPAHQLGETICSGCTLAVQFVPFYVIKASGRLLLFQSSLFEIMQIFARKQYREHNSRLLKKESKGFLVNEKKKLNSLFDVVESLAFEYQNLSRILLKKEKKAIRDPYLTFYYFSNYGQTDPNSALIIYHFPNSVFHFIREIIQSNLENEWRKVVIQGLPKKHQKDMEKAFTKSDSTVYQFLLEGKPITGFLYDRKNRRNIVSWSFVELYLEMVRKMNQEKIELIKKLGDKIALIADMTHSIKRINALDRSKSYDGFRTTLIQLSKEWLALEQKEPFITVDDYLKELLPDGLRSWREIRDLLLIRIYEVASKEILAEISKKISESIEQQQEEE